MLPKLFFDLKIRKSRFLPCCRTGCQKKARTNLYRLSFDENEIKEEFNHVIRHPNYSINLLQSNQFLYASLPRDFAVAKRFIII